MTTAASSYSDFVFVNCPFDPEYTPILQAIVYTIYRCGFFPKTALAEDDGTEFRLNKIMRLIQESKYGIHDISRTEVNSEGFPRFNMPFELGVFFGAKRFGAKEQKNKNALILERNKFSYQQYISDLNGIDTKAHGNDPDIAIRKVRDWLSTASKRSGIPGHTVIQREYRQFLSNLPDVIEDNGFEPDDIPFNDFRAIVERAVKNNLYELSGL